MNLLELDRLMQSRLDFEMGYIECYTSNAKRALFSLLF